MGFNRQCNTNSMELSRTPGQGCCLSQGDITLFPMWEHLLLLVLSLSGVWPLWSLSGAFAVYWLLRLTCCCWQLSRGRGEASLSGFPDLILALIPLSLSGSRKLFLAVSQVCLFRGLAVEQLTSVSASAERSKVGCPLLQLSLVPIFSCD